MHGGSPARNVGFRVCLHDAFHPSTSVNVTCGTAQGLIGKSSKITMRDMEIQWLPLLPGYQKQDRLRAIPQWTKHIDTRVRDQP